jgi:hypothetical protein
VSEPSFARSTRSAPGLHKPPPSEQVQRTTSIHSTRADPSRSCGIFEQTGASTVRVEARSRPRSVSEPCVCPSARTDVNLEGITAWAHKKRTGPSLQAEGPVQLLHCRLERPKRFQHAHRRDFSDCSCRRPSRPAARSPGDWLGRKRSMHAFDAPSPRVRDGAGLTSGTRKHGQ